MGQLPVVPAEEWTGAGGAEACADRSQMGSTAHTHRSTVRSARDEQGVKLLTWTKTREEFRLIIEEQRSGNAFPDIVPVLEDRLFLVLHGDVDLSHYFESGVQTRTVKVHKSFAYRPFCADFGPMNLGMTFHFGQVCTVSR